MVGKDKECKSYTYSTHLLDKCLVKQMGSGWGSRNLQLPPLSMNVRWKIDSNPLLCSLAQMMVSVKNYCLFFKFIVGDTFFPYEWIYENWQMECQVPGKIIDREVILSSIGWLGKQVCGVPYDFIKDLRNWLE